MNYSASLGPLSISFQRTAKLAAHEPPHRLQSHGALPIVVLSAGKAIVPVRDEEAVWLGLESMDDTPVALRVFVGANAILDAVSGRVPSHALERDPQNYVVVPPQQWLEGVTASAWCARQFVRVGDGAHHAEVHAFRFVAMPSRRGQRLRPLQADMKSSAIHPPKTATEPANCALDGHAEQAIHADPYGIDTWDLDAAWELTVELSSAADFESATGEPAPARADPGERYGGWRLP